MEIKTQYLSEKDEDLQRAAKLLQQGKTVIFPTETVYGLGANALDADAAEKIFAAKGRPSDNPLIVHIGETDILSKLVREIPEKAEALMKKFWPGPLTLIFPKSDLVPRAVTGGLDTVAIRMPAHGTARRLLALAKVPVAAPSANRSGFPSPTIFSHVKEDMDGRVDAIVMGGDCEVGLESTVLDLSGKEPVLYRPGAVTLEQLEEAIGPVRVVTAAKEGESPKSPGLKYRHYAPRAEVQILRGNMEQVKEYAKQCCDAGKTGMLVFEEFPCFDSRLVLSSLGSRKEPKMAAKRLFAALRELDEQGATLILAPEIPEQGIWRAVRNRLYRAAGEKMIDLEDAIKHVLFVCTGNTCRSPMAEGLLREEVKRRNVEMTVASAGLSATHALASEKAIAVMKEIGIDISGHRARSVTLETIQDADLVLTMTADHKRILSAVFPAYLGKIYTLGAWAGEEADVKDPYGGSIEDYRDCRDQLRKWIERGCSKNL